MSKIIEKDFIPEFFKNYTSGRFLEIGANDGEPGGPNEPVWPLVEMGWSGVYCEPNPHACSKLLKNIRPYNKDIQVVNCAVNKVGGLKKFYMSDEYPMSASLDPDWIGFMDFVKPGTYQYPIVTNTITMQQLVDFVGTDFDCISIDVENHILFYKELVESFDWSVFKKCKVLVMELQDQSLNWYFESIGYTRLGQSEYNTIFVR